MDTEPKAREGARRPRKRRRQEDGPNKVSVSKLKKKIRDVQRLLSRENLKANVREDHERELGSLNKQLEVATKMNKEQKMAKKYQMVRFVERQKATRKLRQAEKLFQQDSSAENQEAVEKYTLDLYYTMHFPLTEKYIALYPKTTIESKEVLDKQNRIRQQLKDEMTQRKKKSSGSNDVQLGKRKVEVLEDDESDVEKEDTESEEDDGKKGESEEDEFLQF